MVCVALYLGEILLGYKATPEMSKVIEADKVAKKWAHKLGAFYKSGSVEKPPKLLTMRFQTGVRENINDRWGSYLQQFRLAVSPTDTDRQVVGLPALLSPLYYLIRPLRVIYQKTRK